MALRRERSRRGKTHAGKKADAPLSPSEELRRALDELRGRADKRQRGRKQKRRHIDDYRELDISGTQSANLSEALLDLTKRSYADRHRLQNEGHPRMELPPLADEDRGSDRLRRQAAQAAQQMRDEMRRLGIRERTHYYAASGRRETGEVDRTYRVTDPGEPHSPTPEARRGPRSRHKSR